MNNSKVICNPSMKITTFGLLWLVAASNSYATPVGDHLTEEEKRAIAERRQAYRDEAMKHWPGGGDGGAQSCDVGQVHEQLMDRFKLPEIPSSLEDCGIGGFLNFDFSFGIGDIDLSSLFCDFAQDAIGSFKESMKVDFKLDQNGVSINSPIYSMNTKGVDDMAEELLYGSTGVDKNGQGLLGDVEDAYRDTTKSIKRTFSDDSRQSTGGWRSGSGKSAQEQFQDAVRGNSSVDIDKMQQNLENIKNVETRGKVNTTPGNTTIRDMDGNQQSIGGSIGDVELTDAQLDKLSRIPEDMLKRMSEENLAGYLNLTEMQVRSLRGDIPTPTRPKVGGGQGGTIGGGHGGTKHNDLPVQPRYSTSSARSNLTPSFTESLTSQQKQRLEMLSDDKVESMTIADMSDYLRLNRKQRDALKSGGTGRQGISPVKPKVDTSGDEDPVKNLQELLFNRER